MVVGGRVFGEDGLGLALEMLSIYIPNYGFGNAVLLGPTTVEWPLEKSVEKLLRKAIILVGKEYEDEKFALRCVDVISLFFGLCLFRKSQA